ncbi:FHA domain-containing protein, partial [Myxococcota bacterium]|nr:FHA domain-containing protein [Myxococcota bacterium]
MVPDEDKNLEGLGPPAKEHDDATNVVAPQVSLDADYDADFDGGSIGNPTLVDLQAPEPFPEEGFDTSVSQHAPRALIQEESTLSDPDSVDPEEAIGTPDSEIWGDADEDDISDLGDETIDLGHVMPDIPLVGAGVSDGGTLVGDEDALGEPNLGALQAAAAAMGGSFDGVPNLDDGMGPVFPGDNPDNNGNDPWEREAEKSEEFDGWGEFDDATGAWNSVSDMDLPPGAKGGSVDSVKKDSLESAAGGQYVRRDTDVYKLGNEGRSDEGARLIGFAGRDTGREFGIDQKETTIGRGAECDIVLVDSSTSRVHARLLKDEAHYVLMDNKSANGTAVNGDRIDRARVRSGDILHFGNTRFRFLEIGDVFKPVDASGAPVLPGGSPSLIDKINKNPHFKTMLMVGAIFFVTLSLVIGIVVSRQSGQVAKPQSGLFFQYFEQGVEAFRRRAWDEAEAQFKILLSVEPDHKRGKRYLEEVGKERKAEKLLSSARQTLSEGDMAQALAQASAIKNSVYSPDAQEIIRSIDTEVERRVTQARILLNDGKKDEALEFLSAINVIRPGREDVASLVRSATQETPVAAPQEGSDEPVAKQTSPSESSSASSKQERRKSSASAPPKPERSASAVDRALAAFHKGDGLVALKILKTKQEKRDARILSAKITKFLQIYDKALLHYRSKQTGDAIHYLRQARVFVTKISRSRSEYEKKTTKMLADMHYLEGIALRSGGRFPDAYAAYRAALRAYP